MGVELIKARVGILGWAPTNYLPNCQNMHAIEKDFDPMWGRGALMLILLKYHSDVF